MSEAIDNGNGKLAAALAKAQAQIQHADMGRVNPHFRNKYATLADIWDACREALTSNGLSVVQMPRTEVKERGMLVHVETVLLHESGQSMTSTLTMPVDKVTAQGVGSAITYARRYALAAVVGVAPDDDDGNEASRRDTRPAPRGEDPAKAALAAIAKAKTVEQLSNGAAAKCKAVPQSHDRYDEVRDAYAKRRDELTEAA